jgi:hypothetical protein
LAQLELPLLAIPQLLLPPSSPMGAHPLLIQTRNFLVPHKSLQLWVRDSGTSGWNAYALVG